MNQDQVKAALANLRPCKVAFSLVFSGKSNRRVNGLYKPGTCEIVIHNRNFTEDNDLLFTALHEYAHHLMCTEIQPERKSSPRCHTQAFWSTLHDLLSAAEATGLYRNPAKAEDFSAATAGLQGLITQSGEILIAIGRALIEAQALCAKHGARFDDYVMRTLKQSMAWARACMAAAGYNLPAELGAENLKACASIKDDGARAATATALEGDKSPQQVKTTLAVQPTPEDQSERLKKELERITRTIYRLEGRKAELEEELSTENEPGGER